VSLSDLIVLGAFFAGGVLVWVLATVAVLKLV
jgi:hypothetical protein